MLEIVSQGFKAARDRLTGARRINAENLDDALREVRMSLLEADVDLTVVKNFLDRVKERSLGKKILTRTRDSAGRLRKVTPGQHFIGICQEELTALMGPVSTELNKQDSLTSVMLVGLQGVGKTSFAAKLANRLLSEGRRPLLVAADVYRPAAVQQLQTLGERIEVPVHIGDKGYLPPLICENALNRAQDEGFDAIIFDTAGRLAIDNELMQELEEIREKTNPANTLLICDALMGRDAVNTAATFHQRLPLDGLVLTKLDGDARGGAALAMKAVTGVPIKFLSTGEGFDRLETFRPEGLASRILGMGDIVGLVKDFEAVVDTREAEQEAERLLSGKFGMDDLLAQLRAIQKMGSLKDVLGKLPMFNQVADRAEDGDLVKVESMIQSMTSRERKSPEAIDRSRAERIAEGSGRKIKEVLALIKRFEQMKNLMSKLGPGSVMGKGNPDLGQLANAGPGGQLDPTLLTNQMMGHAGPIAGKVSQRQRQAQKRKRKQARKDRKKGRKH